MTERMEKTSVFGHAMFGGARGSSPLGSSTNFTMAYGGGLDINATDRVDIRVIQFDWMPIKATGGGWDNNNLRFGFGIVYKLGS
jgi:opacity protein-like surface antigen